MRHTDPAEAKAAAEAAASLRQLNERSREIFKRIVETYLATGEPVGSRNLSRALPMTLSPASVRNVMSDLVLAALAQGRAERLILNKYRLIDRIRNGPEAGDYLAADPFDRQVHIQIIAPGVTHDMDLFSRFRQVAQRARH